MFKILKNVISEKDILLVNDYFNYGKFHNKSQHSPLHNNLFQNNTKIFEITTYGDMGKEISFVFDKISKLIANETSIISAQEYGPPILTKSYIMKFDGYNELNLGFDANRPNNVFRSLVFWNKQIKEIDIKFNNIKKEAKLSIGDIIIFPETQEFERIILNNTLFPIYISDFWNAPKNQSPYPGLHYEDIAWGNPMYDKID